MRLTLNSIEIRLADIKIMAESGDDENAHYMEKNLWEDVLKALAEDFREDSQQLATMALETKDIKFCRWYA